MASPLRAPYVPVVLALLCSLPLWLSLPSLTDPFGQTEESVNATIWALGARNLLAEGPLAARLGAKVAPFPGPGDGIYAHHPPLPVWLTALVLLTGDREAGPRLAALLLAGLSLLLLFQTLRLVVDEVPALAATAAIATCPYLLGFGRLLSTLTLAAPLLLLALRTALLRGLAGRPWRWTFPAVLAALVLSSWDGTLGAIAAAAYVFALDARAARAQPSRRAWLRAAAPGLTVAFTLAGVLTYLIWANGGVEPLLWQARYRASYNLPPAGDWAAKQLRFISGGLGWANLLLLAGAAGLALLRRLPRGLSTALVLSAIPGVGMTLLFRQGADRHPFWSYNLILPAAFAVAAALQRAAGARRPSARIALAAVFVLQAVIGFRSAADQLARERLLNSQGALARDYFRAHPAPLIRIVSAYNFYPFVSWYLRVPTEVAPSVDEARSRLRAGAWAASDPLVVDMDLARRVGCRAFPVTGESANRRWVIAATEAVVEACTR